MEDIITLYIILWVFMFVVLMFTSMGVAADWNRRVAKLLVIGAFMWPIPSIILYIYKLYK